MRIQPASFAFTLLLAFSPRFVFGGHGAALGAPPAHHVISLRRGFGRYRDIADSSEPSRPADLWVHGLAGYAHDIGPMQSDHESKSRFQAAGDAR